ncbi:DUF1850 domain-containing protein [Desulfosarcina sp.]|uniref:DUF1850 domain-containing protein n=1 Tax=Desulfosarcina sp. TaxID=2027861 RepID=UPI00356B470B
MRGLLAGVLAFLLAACSALDSHSDRAHPCLAISRFPSRMTLGIYRLPEDGGFSLSFIHSVSHTPVRDDYQAIDWRIIQTAETFQAHGAGLPSGVDEPDVTGWEHDDGRFVIRMERPISRLVVRTDRNYRNRLQIDGMEINLNGWDDQALELAVVPCTAP